MTRKGPRYPLGEPRPNATCGFSSPPVAGTRTRITVPSDRGRRTDDRTYEPLSTAPSVGLFRPPPEPAVHDQHDLREAIPQGRGMRDGVAGAVLKGAAGAVAVIVSSVLVGRLAGRRG